MLLGIVRQATKTNMQDCWSFTCCFSWTLSHRQNVACFSLSYRYYFGRCSSELAQLLPLPFSREGSTRYSDRLHDFLSPFPDVTRMSLSTVFLYRTARLWNSLPIESFPLTYNLNGFKSRINRHLLTGSFWRDFLCVLIFLCIFFL